jgi:hypothetical protein
MIFVRKLKNIAHIKQKMPSIRKAFLLVEMVGVEPTSRHGSLELSTCLVAFNFYWVLTRPATSQIITLHSEY